MTIFRSKLLVLAALAVLSGVSAFALRAHAQDAAEPTIEASTPDTAPEPSEEAMKAARAYIAVVPAEDEIKAGLEDMLKRVEPSQRVLARSLADKSIDYRALKEGAAKATAESFSVEEIKAMTAFFGSAEGKSIRAKMGAYDQLMQNVMTQALQPFAMKIQENKIQVRQ